MRADDRADNIKCGADIRDPVAKSFICSIFQRSCAGRNRNHFGAKQPHARYIDFLPRHVFRSHIHCTFESHHCRNCCRGNTVLTCTGLRDDAGFAEMFREQDLPDCIIDLVRACVAKVFAFQIYPSLAVLPGQLRCEVQWCRPSDIIPKKGLQLLLKNGIVAGCEIRAFKLQKRADQRFGNETSTEPPEVPVCIRLEIFGHSTASALTVVRVNVRFMIGASCSSFCRSCLNLPTLRDW